MKKIFFILLFAADICQAQNYQCLQRNAKHYFTNSYGYLRGIRIDSLDVTGTDTVYHPFKTGRNIFLSSDTTNGCWLGSHVIQRSDGTYMFNTFWNDTVIIKTQANVGDQWVFYNDTSSHYYIAHVVSADTMTFIGIMDSVKKIRLTSYTRSTINTTDPLNNFELILSKHNGFAKIFDLYMFPYHRPDTTAYDGYDIFLTTIFSRPPYSGSYYNDQPDTLNSIFSLADYHDLTQIELYNFNIGDAFYTQSGSTVYSLTESTFSSENYDSIISKTVIDPYHVEYQMYNWGDYNTYYMGTTVRNIYSPGIRSVTVDTSVIIRAVQIPEEISNGDSMYFYIPNDTACYNGAYYYSGNLPLFEVCDKSQSYKTGFEQLTSATFTPPMPMTGDIGCHSTTTSSLAFSIKSGVYCGTYPMMPNGVAEIAQSDKYKIFPNPAKKELNIVSPNNITDVVITNIVGQVVFSRQYNAEKVLVNVAGLPTGTYIVKVNGSEVRKFVKE